MRNFIQLFGRKAQFVWHDDRLGETLSMFRQMRGHMAIVRDVVSQGEVRFVIVLLKVVCDMLA